MKKTVFILRCLSSFLRSFHKAISIAIKYPTATITEPAILSSILSPTLFSNHFKPLSTISSTSRPLLLATVLDSIFTFINSSPPLIHLPFLYFIIHTATTTHTKLQIIGIAIEPTHNIASGRLLLLNE